MTDQTALTARSGYFGKVPTQGDFIARGLPRPLVDALDHWLRACVRESQRQMGQRWLDAFLVAPIWRFALPPGVAGADAVLGVMMPSVDRIGRYFPLIIAATPKAASMEGNSPPVEAWCAAAEQLALSTLEPSFSMAEFDTDAERLTLLASAIPTASVSQQRLEPPHTSHWWQSPSSTENTFCAQGLPQPHEFAARFMIDATSAAPNPAPAPIEPATPHVLLDVDCAGASLKGTRSAVLTDMTVLSGNRQAMSLVSGVGAHPGMPGAVKVVGDTLAAIENPFSMNDLIAEAKGKLGTANALLRARGIPAGDVFAASTVTLLVQAQRYAILWAGNARAYLLRDGALSCLTRDHTETRLPNILTRAIGGAATLSLDSAIGRALPGDRFLLCSQGVVMSATDVELGETLASAASAHHAATHLTQDAIISGATLDASALAVILTARA